MIIKYLWYKLYRASLKSSLKEIPILFSGALFSLILHINIFTLSLLLSKMDVMPFIYKDKIYAIVGSIILLILTWIYFSGNRAKSIIDSFSIETDKQRVRGNIFVILYVSISITLFFLIIFYRPGYLP